MLTQTQRLFGAIFGYPLTWLAFFIVISAEGAFMAWFEPPLLIALALIGTGIFLVLMWFAIFTRSEVFRRRFNQMPEAMDSDELVESLRGCHPAFEKAARECLTMIRKIREEFRNKSFRGEVDWLMKNLDDLTRNHLLLYSRSKEFGTEEQKQAMDEMIRQQIKSVEDSLVALRRFGGNLTLFDSQVGEQKEIDSELKLINQGLQEAIKEVLSPLRA